MGIPIGSLIQYEDIGTTEKRTWVHRKIAIDLAQWINVDFRIKVNDWIE